MSMRQPQNKTRACLHPNDETEENQSKEHAAADSRRPTKNDKSSGYEKVTGASESAWCQDLSGHMV